MGPIEQATMTQLEVMFPNLTRDLIERSVMHPSNREPPFDEGHLLQRCIDDLLDLRTFKLSVNGQGTAMNNGSSSGASFGSPAVKQSPSKRMNKPEVVVLYDEEKASEQMSSQQNPACNLPPNKVKRQEDFRNNTQSHKAEHTTSPVKFSQMLKGDLNSRHSVLDSKVMYTDDELPDIVPRKRKRSVPQTPSKKREHRAFNCTCGECLLPCKDKPDLNITDSPAVKLSPDKRQGHKAHKNLHSSPMSHSPKVNKQLSVPQPLTISPVKNTVKQVSPQNGRTPGSESYRAAQAELDKFVQALTQQFPSNHTALVSTIAKQPPVTKKSHVSVAPQSQPQRVGGHMQPPVMQKSHVNMSAQSQAPRFGGHSLARHHTPKTDNHLKDQRSQHNLQGPVMKQPSYIPPMPQSQLPANGMSGFGNCAIITSTLSAQQHVASNKLIFSNAGNVVNNFGTFQPPLINNSFIPYIPNQPQNNYQASQPKPAAMPPTGSNFNAKQTAKSSGCSIVWPTLPQNNRATSTNQPANAIMPGTFNNMYGNAYQNVAVTDKPADADVIVVTPSSDQKNNATNGGMFSEQVAQVLQLFPDACPDMLRQKIEENFFKGDAVNIVCNYLIENPGYPKKPSKPAPQPVTNKPVTQDKVDHSNKDQRSKYRSRFPDDVCTEFVNYLANEFRQLGKGDLAKTAIAFDFHFDEIHRCLTAALAQAGACDLGLWKKNQKEEVPKSVLVTLGKGDRKKDLSFNLMKHLRGRRKLEVLSPELKSEIASHRREMQCQSLTSDESQTALQEQTESSEAMIECGCCYCDFTFDEMVQCYEGHLFCEECLRRYAKETVFGQGKISLECMADGCEYSFPKSQLEKALPAEVRKKYEERMQEESLNLADLEDLVRCKHCDFAAVMDQDDKVFKCQNPACMKETCRHCGVDWAEHFGLRCNEVEQNDETTLRTTFEEKMTEAKIRKCWQCKTSFTKLDGCNKITCRCGAKMCYICRKPKIDYNHFCQHPRQPGKPCDKCTVCSLWSSPEEDDERAVREIRKQAQAERVKEGYTENKLIGAPDEGPPSKKRKYPHQY